MSQMVSKINQTSRSIFRQAYERAPWRLQVQGVGLTLLVLVVVAIVSLFYLNVSTKTAALGRQIQFNSVRLDGPHRFSVDDPEGTIIPIEEIDIRIAGLRARLAELTSLQRLEKRADELGFQPVEPEEIVYLQIPGYQPPAPVQIAPNSAPQVAPASAIRPVRRESLIDEVSRNWRTLVDKVMREAIP